MQKLVSLADRETDKSVLDILSAAVGNPTPEKLRQVAEVYRDADGWALFGLDAAGRLVSVIGIERVGGTGACIQHIATIEKHHRAGHARHLIEAVVERLGLSSLWAETNRSAVGFYERCGFAVQSLGEKYPGVERFHCTWRR